MKHENIKLASCNDIPTLLDAITGIENDRVNYNCTIRQWLDGHPASSNLKAGAIKKLKALNTKLDKYDIEM